MLLSSCRTDSLTLPFFITFIIIIALSWAQTATKNTNNNLNFHFSFDRFVWFREEKQKQSLTDPGLDTNNKYIAFYSNFYNVCKNLFISDRDVQGL